MSNQIEKENCQLVMRTLNHFDEPVSLAKIVNHMSIDQKMDKKVLKEPIEKILDIGTQQGFIQKIKNLFSLKVSDETSDAPMKRRRGRPAVKKPSTEHPHDEETTAKTMKRKNTRKPATKRKATKSDDDQHDAPAKRVRKTMKKSARKPMTRKTAPKRNRKPVKTVKRM